MTSARRSGLFAAGVVALVLPFSATSADVPRCDPVLEGARQVKVKDADVTARQSEHVRAVCAAQDSSIDRWSRVLSDIHLDNTRMIAAANARNWNGVADALDHAVPLLDQLVTQAHADTARPHGPDRPIDPRLAGFVRLATDSYRTRLVTAGLPPPASLRAGLADLSRALRTRGDGQLATTAYVLGMDLSGNADDLAGILGDEAAAVERRSNMKPPTGASRAAPTMAARASA